MTARYTVTIAATDETCARFGIEPGTIYDVVLTRGGHPLECSLAEARRVARVMSEDSGRHTRVVVVGCDRDAADYGPRPKGYRPASITARARR